MSAKTSAHSTKGMLTSPSGLVTQFSVDVLACGGKEIDAAIPSALSQRETHSWGTQLPSLSIRPAAS
jgi:gamma-glutamyltranspeptidase